MSICTSVGSAANHLAPCIMEANCWGSLRRRFSGLWWAASWQWDQHAECTGHPTCAGTGGQGIARQRALPCSHLEDGSWWLGRASSKAKSLLLWSEGWCCNCQPDALAGDFGKFLELCKVQLHGPRSTVHWSTVHCATAEQNASRQPLCCCSIPVGSQGEVAEGLALGSPI